MKNQAINEDILEMIELFINCNASNKNSDKSKSKQMVSNLFNYFLCMKSKNTQSTNSSPKSLSFDNSLVEKIDSLEKKLYKQNFSYSQCVKEKIESKNNEKEGNKQILKSEAEEEGDNKTDNKEKEKENSEKKEEEEEEGEKDAEEYFRKGEGNEEKAAKQKSDEILKEEDSLADLDEGRLIVNQMTGILLIR